MDKQKVIQSIKNQNLAFFAQKIYDINLKCQGIEILARIPVNGSYISGSQFMYVVERENLFIDLDKAVLTCLQNQLTKLKNKVSQIYVNIYPLSLLDKDIENLVQKLNQTAKSYNIILNLELTEYATVKNVDYLQKFLEDNINFVIDDFGSKYTNYTFIGECISQEIIKTIKIDGEIIKRITQEELFLKIVEQISFMGKYKPVKIVYEHIENENIMSKLLETIENNKIPTERIMFQGYYLHKTAPIENLFF